MWIYLNFIYPYKNMSIFITDPINQLSSFEHVIDAFKKFPEGGFWIKKIIQRMGIFRETVVGPYTKIDADKIADRWRKIFKFEGKEVAHVLQFKDLICSPSPPEIGDYSWKPPIGSGMLCVLYNYIPIVVYDTDDVIKSQDFYKFSRYTYPDGIRISLFDEKVICYNRNNIDSQRRSDAMRQFLINDTDGYVEKQVEWLVRKISNKNTKDLEKPKIIPGYISRLDFECDPVELDFFKQKTNLSDSFNRLKKCAPDDRKKFFFYKDIRFEAVEADLLIEDKILNYGSDVPVTTEMIRKSMKRLVIEKGNHGKYNLLLTNNEGNFSIGIYAIEKGAGKMIIHLPESDYSLLTQKQSIFIGKSLRKNRYFTKMDVNGAILLYIAKCLGVKKVWLEDEKVDECNCGVGQISSFINPVRFLAGQFSIYANLGFKNVEQEKLDEIVEVYKKEKVPIREEYSSPSSSSSSDEEDEEDEDGGTMNISDLAHMYLSKDCTYENLCQVMKVITEDMYEQIPNKYELDLDKMSLEYYRQLF
jgi:hypothetical protein